MDLTFHYEKWKAPHSEGSSDILEKAKLERWKTVLWVPRVEKDGENWQPRGVVGGRQHMGVWGVNATIPYHAYR